MSTSQTSPQFSLLRAKLALAIGPIEVNLAYDEVKAERPGALDEPWSGDMSGGVRYVGMYYFFFWLFVDFEWGWYGMAFNDWVVGLMC